MTATHEAAEKARIDQAPGAVPPTGGVPPEDAHEVAHAPPLARVLSEDLVDGLDLLLRATRRTLGTVDTELEQSAQRAIARLQQIGERSASDAAVISSAEQQQVLSAIAHGFGREIDELTRRLAQRIEQL